MYRLFVAAGLVLCSLILLACLLELVVFRFIFIPSDLPRLAATNAGEVLRFSPSQEGTYRVKNEISARFRINDRGWNSGHVSYKHSSDSSRSLIAIIGDSYVEALQVDHTASVAEILEHQLTATDVYRFGLSGAPLSQYLFVYRREVEQFNPDHTIFLLVHNDFKESIVGSQTGLYTSSFAKWHLQRDGAIGQLQLPLSYDPFSIATLIRSTNLYRYFVVRMRVNVSNLKRRVLKLLSSDTPPNSKHIANVDIFGLDDSLVENVATTFFEELELLAEETEGQFLVLMDGARGLDGKKCKNGGDRTIQHMNNIVSETAKKHGIKFIDLSEAFYHAQCKKGLALRFKIDGHWTESAHTIAADIIQQYLTRDSQ
jgi:hypothetical protein